MFVMLSKLLPQFVYPMGLVTILLIISLIFSRIKKANNAKKWSDTAVILSLLIIFITGNGYVANSLVRSLEWRYFPPEGTPQAQVIVVLGGGTDAPQYPRTSVEINGAGDRILTGARLYHQDAAPYILLSGGSIEWLDNREASTAADEMAQILEMLDVPSTDILMQRKSRNTYEDAYYSKQVLDEMKFNRILLVTSASHMPRAVALFEHQGLEVIPYPTDYSITRSKWNSLFESNITATIINIFPSTNHMGTTTGAIREYIGMFVYRLRGWM